VEIIPDLKDLGLEQEGAWAIVPGTRFPDLPLLRDIVEEARVQDSGFVAGEEV